MVQTNLPNRLTVLLANEQEGWHQTVRGLLEPQGVQTVAARSGREALELMERTPVHVAVLDTMARVLKRHHHSRWPQGPTTTNS
jgi:CheY-like chemotaxis protein